MFCNVLMFSSLSGVLRVFTARPSHRLARSCDRYASWRASHVVVVSKTGREHRTGHRWVDANIHSRSNEWVWVFSTCRTLVQHPRSSEFNRSHHECLHHRVHVTVGSQVQQRPRDPSVDRTRVRGGFTECRSAQLFNRVLSTTRILPFFMSLPLTVWVHYNFSNFSLTLDNDCWLSLADFSLLFV